MTPARCQAQTGADLQCTRQARDFMYDYDDTVYAWSMFWACHMHRQRPPVTFVGSRVRAEDVPPGWEINWVLALERRQAALDDVLLNGHKQAEWARQELERARALVHVPPS